MFFRVHAVRISLIRSYLLLDLNLQVVSVAAGLMGRAQNTIHQHGKASLLGPTGGLSETLAFEKAHFKSLFCQKRPFSSYRAQLGPSRPNSADWPARARPRRRPPASVPGPRPGTRSPAGAPGPSQGPARDPAPGPGPRSGAPWRTLKSGFRKKVPL